MAKSSDGLGHVETVNPDDQKPQDDDQFAVKGNDLTGYVGVSPEYQTYAEDTQKPVQTDEDEAALEGDDEDDQDESEDYDTWTQPELEEELKERKLPYSGTKAEQVARLQASDDA